MRIPICLLLPSKNTLSVSINMPGGTFIGYFSEIPKRFFQKELNLKKKKNRRHRLFFLLFFITLLLRYGEKKTQLLQRPYRFTELKIVFRFTTIWARRLYYRYDISHTHQ